MGFQEFKQIDRSDQGQLDNFSKGVANISLALRGNKGRVQNARGGGVKGSHAILVGLSGRVAAVINSILDTDTGIDNGQKCGGHTDKGNSTTVETSSHTGNVQQDTTSNGQKWFTSTQLVGTQGVEEGIDGGGAFVGFPAIQNAHGKINAIFRKVGLNAITVNLVHGRIHHGETAVVAFGVHARRIEQLRIERVQECAMGNDIDIVRNG
mmetsp:Transcript_37570/g.77970  ORF Transcript_37570/g.77970 Transcript_37570/m.77970 type:complete len:209 (+) Transcript_37570:231-857(+)